MFPSMHFSKRHPDSVPIGQPRLTRAEVEYVQGWLGHVDAGRIGTPTIMPAEELAVQRANEMAVLGRTPSFPVPVTRPALAWGR